jgi:hypothetical protein
MPQRSKTPRRPHDPVYRRIFTNPRMIEEVLYNGEEPWTAPLALDELIEPVEGMKRPRFEYVVLDASHFSADRLRPVEDVVSGVFLMEQVESLAELESVVEDLEGLVGDRELEQDIALLVSNVLAKSARKGEKAPRLRTLQEVRNMLAERVAKWPLGRYAGIARKELGSYRIVQDTHFSLGGASGGTGVAGTANAVETHVFLETSEDDGFARRLVDMGEQTCFLHALCRTDLRARLRLSVGRRG